MFRSTKKKGKKRSNLNESFDSFSMMSPEMKNMTSAKLKFMVNNQETFELYNTKHSIGGPSTTSRKNNKGYKMDSTLKNYSKELNLNDRSDGSLNTTFNQRDIKTLEQSNIQFAFNTRYDEGATTMMLRNNSIQKLDETPHIGGTRRSKSTTRGQASFHNLGVVFNKNGSMGPS